MNHPARPLPEQLALIAAQGFAFVDLTAEPPGAWPLDGAAVARALDDAGLGVVGHTPWYLPLGSPLAELRAASRTVLGACFDELAAAGARLVNVHPRTGGGGEATAGVAGTAEAVA